MKKKILLALLIVSMLVCLFAISASAVVIDGIDYSFSGEEATVTSKNQSCELKEVVIPETVTHEGKTYTVTVIANSAFRNNSVVTSITTPSTIKNIYPHAFREMKGLLTLKLNASEDFKYFDDAEVYKCTALVEADLSGCVGLIDLGNGGSYCHTFLGCTSLSKIVLPEGLQVIGHNVFNGCTSLVDVKIPSTVTKIGDYAFQSCRSLKTMNLPEGLTYLGCNNFQFSKVEKVIFPSTLVTATKDMFNDVRSTLHTVVIANSDVSGYTSSVLTNCGPLNFVFYAGDDVSVLTNKFTNLKSYTTVTYEQYLTNLANPEFAGYTSKIIVYGTQNCKSCGDVKTNETSFQFADFISEMYDANVCSCGEKSIVNTYAPIITFAGYSAKINGDKVCVGYTVNHSSLEVYEAKTSKTLSLGVTAAVVADGTEQYETLTDELSPVNDKTIVASVNGEYVGFDFILSGFTSVHYEKLLVMCAYVYDGSDVYYVDYACNTYATPFTFNSIAK